MRQIKFRIWDGHTKSFFGTPDTHYLPKLNVDENGIMTIEPKDETYHLMQFTGLTDRNGKEIYEGDIYRSFPFFADSVEVPYRSEGYWENKDGKFTGEWIEKYCVVQWNNGYKLPEPVSKRVEIIGNVWENPELLK